MNDEECLPISLVVNYLFCPRRAWLEIMDEKVESEVISRGTYDHRAVDQRERNIDDGFQSVDVRHEAWGIVGRLDAVSMGAEGVVIREYKSTPIRRSMEVTPAMRVQLALQAACLEDMGYRVAATEIFFTTHHRRVDVHLEEADYEQAWQAVCNVRELCAGNKTPEPLEDDERCFRCSHAGICLPEERRLASISRKITVSVPDHQVTHLTTPGAKAFSRGGRMVVYKEGVELASIPLDAIQGLELDGNTDVSSGLIRELLWRNIPIVWCSGSGRLYGWATSSYGPNGPTRVEQHVASHEGRLGLARAFVCAKIHNQSVLLRRSDRNNLVLDNMRRIERQVSNANTWSDVIGVEGEAAALYFSQFATLIKPDKREAWPWTCRMRRPAPDALNALLDFTYALLLADCVRALISCGLDPHAGFLHSSKRNKPALALGLMEEFRAPIADSIVQTVVNNGQVHPEGFIECMHTMRMRDDTRKTVVQAYERRMETLITHPLFGYQASWRRIVEIQARLILGYLDGTQQRYKGIRVR